MKKIVAFIVIAGLFSTVSANPIINGSFESGLTGYSTYLGVSGNIFVTSSLDGYYATNGSKFAVLQATSELSQNYSAAKNEILTFNWNFDAQDYMPYNDYSIFSLAGSGTNFSLKLSDVSQVGNYGKTGWQTYTYTFQNNFNGTFKFGSYNALDNAVSSYLFVDNIKSSYASVPEPGLISLLGIGFLSLAGFAMRKKRTTR